MFQLTVTVKQMFQLSEKQTFQLTEKQTFQLTEKQTFQLTAKQTFQLTAKRKLTAVFQAHVNVCSPVVLVAQHSAFALRLKCNGVIYVCVCVLGGRGLLDQV